MLHNIGLIPERTAILGFPETAEISRLAGTAGNVLYVNGDHVNADDGNDGTDPLYPVATVAEAISKAVAGDTIYIAPMEDGYNEAVTIARTKPNLTLIGAGGRGAVFIAPSAANSTAVTIHADDVTLINVGCDGDGTGSGCVVTGSRFRAYGSKFEGGANGLVIGPGTVAQEAAGTHGVGADSLVEDCEFAWSTATGVLLKASDYGACTQNFFRKCKFHNLTAASFEESTGTGGAAGVLFRNLEISDCQFDDMEDGTAPTAWVLLNGDNANTGIVTRCAFPTAINSGDNLVSTALHWVSNYHTGGISTAQPS